MDFPERPFHLFGASHLAALATTAGLAAALILVARGGRFPRLVLWQNVLLGLALLWTYPADVLACYLSGYDVTEAMLPMHFCDWAAIAGFIALFWGRPLACEILFFFGLAGTTQGLVTPAITIDFPHPTFFSFFLLHTGVVVAALYLPLGLGWRPRPGVFLRMVVWCHIYLVVAAAVDIIGGRNYGYLSAKPPASLMDAMPEWPYYIPMLQVIAVAMLALLSLPFVRFRPFATLLRVRAGSARHSPARPPRNRAP